jgi:site-specific DNA recombinase
VPKLVIASENKSRQPDPDLCRLIAKGRYWLDQLASGEAASVKEIARKEKIFDTEVTRVLPLAFLAPEIVKDILEGRQPEGLTVRGLARLNPLPTDWHEQKKRLGYPN